ncbi:diguanylate cyclase domain-containing protein [Aquipuribacter nitratireducens]|uniref:Diguanylate cyclase domain-containing protein n=1 Tax=Aquipuribacter nitratireducens TaxID=650104 RepID=A0ABW0GSM1_9MICO
MGGGHGRSDRDHERERARLEALHGYGVLDTPPAPELEALVRVAAHLAGVPTATLNLLDTSRQCQLTTVGFEGGDSPREHAMCDVTVQTEETVTAVDARHDPRFWTNPWVDGRYARVRGYASVPLRSPAGHVLGSLCVFDSVPFALDDEQLSRLEDCAALVVAMFERAKAARVEQERHQLLDTVLETAAVGIVVSDAAGRVSLFNRTAREWHGADADPVVASEELPARYHLCEPDGRTPLPAADVPLLRALTEDRVDGVAMSIAVPGRDPVLVVASARRLLGPDGRTRGAVVAMADVTAQRRQEAELRSSEERFRSAFDRAPSPLAVTGADGTWLDVNPALCAWLGHNRDELLGRPAEDVLHPDDAGEVAAARRSLLDGSVTTTRLTVRYRHRRGEEMWGALSLAVVTAPDGGRQLVTQVEDLQERRAVEQRLAALALHDPLTGLPNRLLLLERLGHALALSARDGSRHAVLFCDLDRFKAVNDTHGHAVGDEVLVAVAERLLGLVRPSDTVARLGGDEFVVLCEAVAEPDVASVTARLQASLARPFRTSVGLLEVGVSIGVAHPVEGSGPDAAAEALDAADRQMYRAKRRARGAVSPV